MSDSRYKSIRRTIMGLLKYKTEKMYEMNLSKKELQDLVAKEIEKIYKERDGFDLQENYLDKLISDISTKFGIEEENEIKTFSSQEVDHIEWDTDSRVQEIDDHPAWTSYYDYFAEKFPLGVLNDIKRNSSRILFKLEDPKRLGEWGSKGLVIGEVQSGKTMNMLGLVNRSMAAGYKFIIILTGLSEILRVQTQERFDEGVIGRLSASESFFEDFGVSQCREPGEVRVKSITKSSYRSDFKSIDVDTNIQPDADETVILVVKKNTKILENIRDNLRKWNNKNKITKLPLLLIDDECDHASVNTAGENPSKTNALIRDILGNFTRSCYVGFTATAYANIFINHMLEDPELGRDLFPDHISFLPVYNNYIGYSKMFPDEELIEKNPYIEDIDDFISEEDKKKVRKWYEGKLKRKDLDFEDSWLPPTHDKTWKLNNNREDNNLPRSLRDAIHHFIIACAIKKIRSLDTEISTMLIHVSLFNNIHTQLVEHINAYLTKFRERNHSEYESIENELKVYFENKISENLILEYNPGSQALDWSEIKIQLKKIISSIEVIPMNNEYDSANKLRTKELRDQKIAGIHSDNPEIAAQIQSYSNAKQAGSNCICIGGNQLARGLTLEGLTVNYFLRDQKTGNNDTMTQMGRWFGYRDNYDDLCVLYTSGNLLSKFRKFFFQKDNFMRQILSLDSGKYTPRQIGMYIIAYAGVNPTSINKMRNGEEVFVKLIFDTDHIQELDIPTKERDSNYDVINKFLSVIEKDGIKAENNKSKPTWLLWNDVPSEYVLENFFKKYQETEGQVSENSVLLEQETYIREMNKYDELTHWTIGLKINGDVSGTEGQFKLPDRDIKFKAAKRGRRFGKDTIEEVDETWDGRLATLENEKVEKRSYRTGALTDLSWEEQDIKFRHEVSKNKSQTEYTNYRDLCKKDNSKRPKKRQYLRESRNPKYGYLMLCPVFPKTKNTTGENIKPYIGYATSYPQSKYLRENPESIEKIFGPQRKIFNTVGVEKAKRLSS